MYQALSTSKQVEDPVVLCDSKATLQGITKGHSSITHEIISGFQDLQGNNKTCALQWIPAPVEIASNENADKLTNECRNLNTNKNSVSLQDGNAITKSILRENSIQVKHQLCEINADRLITKTIIRLRNGHYRGMKISKEGGRVYRNCNICPYTRLTTCHIFEYPAISASLTEIGVLPSLIDIYEDNNQQIA